MVVCAGIDEPVNNAYVMTILINNYIEYEDRHILNLDWSRDQTYFINMYMGTDTNVQYHVLTQGVV